MKKLFGKILCTPLFVEAFSNQRYISLLSPHRRTLLRKGSHHFSSEAWHGDSLMKYMQARIQRYGPITVADYMKEVLTNSHSGYYMKKDVFGKEGDFITSPEISQMFGEMIGVWVVHEWLNNYKGQKLQVVELGPGRGTLANDMLRVFQQFPDIAGNITLHLVEISPALSCIQEAILSGKDISEVSKDFSPVFHELEGSSSSSVGAYKLSKSECGIDVFWYRDLRDVPRDLSCFIAHEFLDALPVHKFQKKGKNWYEVLIDIDPRENSSLRYVLAPGRTPASIAYLKVGEEDQRNNIEICPGACVTIQEICERIRKDGGLALIADYGHSGEKEDTLRAFRRHKLHHPLEDPGSADITADIDFSFLKSCTNEAVQFFGPITQERFLLNMGIGIRLQVLLGQVQQEHQESLISGFKMLTSPEQMGERFKFCSIAVKAETDYIPAGFLNVDYGSGFS